MKQINFDKESDQIRSFADINSADYAKLYNLALSNQTLVNCDNGSWYSDSLENLEFDE